MQEKVLTCLCLGLSDGEIADRLETDHERIRHHRSLIMLLTGCDNFVELVKLHFMANQIIDVRSKTGLMPLAVTV